MVNTKNLFAIDHPELIGTHRDIDNEVYHSGPGLSKSTLDKVSKSINHWLHAERFESGPMKLGTAVHAKVLEPHVYSNMYMESQHLTRRGKGWTDFSELMAGQGLIALTVPETEKIDACYDAICEHPVSGDLFMAADGVAETSIYGEDPDTGLLLRVRPDFLIPSLQLIVDLKTSTDASMDWGGFPSSAKKYRYDVQDSFYTDVVSREFGVPYTFIFAVVETAPPFNVGVYELSEASKGRGRELYKRDLNTVYSYLAGDQFEGYHDSIKEISTVYGERSSSE